MKIQLLLYLLGIFFPVSVFAQDLLLPKIEEDINHIEQTWKSFSPLSKEEVAAVQTLGQLMSELRDIKEISTKHLASTQKNIEALGNLSSTSEDEKQLLKKQDFIRLLDQEKQQILYAELLLKKIHTLNDYILSRRGKKMKEHIFERQESIWHFQVFAKSVKSFGLFFKEIFTAQVNAYQTLSQKEKNILVSKAKKSGGLILASLVIAFIASLFLKRRFGYKELENPSYAQKCAAGIFTILARGLIPLTLMGIIAWWLAMNTHLFEGAIGVVLKILFIHLLYLLIALTFVRVVFNPRRSQWRIVNVSDERAKSLTRAFAVSFILLFIYSFFKQVALKLDFSNDILFALTNIGNVIKALCLILVGTRLLYDDPVLTDEELKDQEHIQELSTSSKVGIFLVIGVLLVLLASFIGYIRFAEFVYDRFIISVIFLGLIYLLKKLCVLSFTSVMVLKFWQSNLHLTRRKKAKILFLMELAVSCVLYVLSGFFLLAFWGVSVDILLQRTKTFLTGFEVGGMYVSIASIAKGIIAFWFVLFLTRCFKKSLVSGTFSHFDMDKSIKNSILSAAGFFGFISAVLVGISVMGGSLKGLAIVAGALSFGAGLGLQNVVNNFVSGLILLIERPIKIGDWVNINGQEGIVKQINMRSTQLEMFTRANVIIPNADILSSSVTNLTYREEFGRVDIFIDTDNQVDVELVKSLLLEIASEVSGLSKKEDPFVSFMSMEAGLFKFRLSVYITDVNKRLSTMSFINTEIVKRFRSHQIDIPCPKQDVFVHDNKEK